MRNHPTIPGEPIILFFFDSGCSRCLTTWARQTDGPGWSAIRSGISPTAKPLRPMAAWYPLTTDLQWLVNRVVAQGGGRASPHPDHLLDFLLPYDGPSPEERESVEGDPRYAEDQVKGRG